MLSSIELVRDREKDIEAGQRPELVDFITNWDQELKDAYDNDQVVINPAYGRTLLAMDEVGSSPTTYSGSTTTPSCSARSSPTTRTGPR